ncbi:MAG: DegV family protein [Trueperaceae bacterium]|nr:DegV family protein [Trueperaceae bacterium]
MSGLAVVTDRAADLSPAQRRDLDVTVVPLVVRFGDEVVLDDGSLSDDAFWARVASSPTFPQTSQPSAGLFEEAFAPLVAAGRHVLCPVLSGRLSGTVNAAFAAAQRFPGQVTVFDTRSLSLGQAFQVLAAARAAREERPLVDVVRTLEDVRGRTHLVIALDTVEYLRRGGRAGRLMPVLDRVLKALRIRPLLRLEDGDLKVMGVARTRTQSLRRLVEAVAKVGPIEALGVAHTRRPDEAAELAATLVAGAGLPEGATLVTEAGPALSVHAGPGVVAVAVVRRADAPARGPWRRA